MDTNLSEIDVKNIAFDTTCMVLKLNSFSSKEESPIFIDEACTLTGYTKGYLYVLIHKKEIPFHKGARRRKLFFYKSELLTWMKSKEEVING